MDNNIPKTIEELKTWYAEMNLPPEDVTRFFIGKNIQERRAFGIYREGDRFTVYKNKNDGSRAVRYQGYDEAYAVKELYLRLRQEIANQKGRSTANGSDWQPMKEEKPQSKKASNKLAVIIVVALVIVVIIMAAFSHHKGYYRYNGHWYYRISGDWYSYSGGWSPCYFVDDELKDNASDYYEGTDTPFGVFDFEDTNYYSDYEDSDSWSSSDSWDSGGTDFDSDW